MSRLVEIEPGRFRFVKPTLPPARSDLPMPHVISDTMPDTEHVDGQFYTSKSKFRAVTRAHGLTEVGNERVKPKVRDTKLPRTADERRTALKNAVEKYKAGHRPRRG